MSIHLNILFGCFQATMEKLARCNSGLQSPKYLLSDPLKKKVAKPGLNRLLNNPLTSLPIQFILQTAA